MEIIDFNGDLELSHYITPDPSVYKVRGIIKSKKYGKTVCGCIPYTPNFETKKIPDLEDLDEPFSAQDIKGVNYVFNPKGKDVLLYQGFEGTLLRVFKYEDKVYVSTHRKIDGLNSKWGNSKNFGNYFLKYINPESLFSSDKKFGAFCYMFLLVHPDLMFSSRIETRGGFIVYVGHLMSEVIDPVDTDFTLSQIDPISYELLRDNSDTTSRIVFQPWFSEKYINEKLLNFEKKQLDKGEFAVAIARDVDGCITDVMKFSSPSYIERLRIRGCLHEPFECDLYHRFLTLKDLIIKYSDAESLLGDIPESMLGDKFLLLEKLTERLRLSSPLEKEAEILQISERYNSDIERIAKIIGDPLFKTENIKNNKHVFGRLSWIVSKVQNEKKLSLLVKDFTFNEFDSYCYFLLRELGYSFYIISKYFQ